MGRQTALLLLLLLAAETEAERCPSLFSTKSLSLSFSVSLLFSLPPSKIVDTVSKTRKKCVRVCVCLWV